MLFGHEDKVELFKNLAKSGKLGHAYLFFGDHGVGKRTFAEMFARFLEYGSFELSSSLLLDAAVFAPDEKGIISIGAMRSVKKFLFQKPFHSPRRIAIIDESEKLTDEAGSTLLKIVEEPPHHALLFFIARQEEALFPPLLSRLIKVYFSRLSRSALFGVLVSNYGISKDEARKISKKSFGRVGRALEFLEPPKKEENADVLEERLEEKILGLWEKSVLENSRALLWLLDREMLANRYNLNPNIQLKAARHILFENKL